MWCVLLISFNALQFNDESDHSRMQQACHSDLLVPHGKTSLAVIIEELQIKVDELRSTILEMGGALINLEDLKKDLEDFEKLGGHCGLCVWIVYALCRDCSCNLAVSLSFI